MMSTSAGDTLTEPGFDRFSIWGSSVLLATLNPDLLPQARRILDEVLSAVEAAASRFHGETEIIRLNAHAGQGPVEVSTTLCDLVSHALWAWNYTDGRCDPTVADALIALGYDRDFDELLANPSREPQAPSAPAPGLGGVDIDPNASTISLPEGVHLDLGATAKARAADIAATRICEELGTGCLVDLGGDLRIAGETPKDGWTIGIVTSTRDDDDAAVQEVIAVAGGGVTSSSTSVRRWQRGGEELHHVIDPSTGRSAKEVFRLVTVAAQSAVEANALSTAALVWGEDALFELPQRGVLARLVRHDGSIERVGGWPEPAEEQHS